MIKSTESLSFYPQNLLELTELLPVMTVKSLKLIAMGMVIVLQPIIAILVELIASLVGQSDDEFPPVK